MSTDTHTTAPEPLENQGNGLHRRLKRREGRYLVMVANVGFGLNGDTRPHLLTQASSFAEAKTAWRHDRTKRIYRLVSSGRGLK
jgi:hypothetical protein